MDSLKALAILKSEIQEIDPRYDELLLSIEKDLIDFSKIREFWSEYDFKKDTPKIILELKDTPINKAFTKFKDRQCLMHGKQYLEKDPITLKKVEVKREFRCYTLYDVWKYRTQLHLFTLITQERYASICHAFLQYTGLNIEDEYVKKIMESKEYEQIKTRKYKRHYKKRKQDTQEIQEPSGTEGLSSVE